MTTERDAWDTLHPQVTAQTNRRTTCSCGQDLDFCTGRHCPRCGTSFAARAA